MKVAELQKLYQARLAEYGIEKYIHSTAEFDSAQAQTDGKYSIIVGLSIYRVFFDLSLNLVKTRKNY